MHSNSNNTSVFVKGYAESIPKQQLERVFERFGTIKEVRMVKNFAFVSYANLQSAKAAVDQLHNTSHKGDKLTVELSGKQKPRKQQTQSRVKQGDKCNACGKQGHWARQCPQKSSHPRRDQPQRRERSRQRDNGKRQQRSDRRRRQRSKSSSLSSSSSSSSSQSRNTRKRRDQRKEKRSYSSSSNSSSRSSSSSPSPKK